MSRFAFDVRALRFDRAGIAIFLTATVFWSLLMTGLRGAGPPAWSGFWNIFLGQLVGALLMCLAPAWLVTELYRFFLRRSPAWLFPMIAWLTWLGLAVADVVRLP